MSYYRIRVVRRQEPRWYAWVKGIAIGWFIVTGGLSGVLLGAIITNVYQPGHPLYVAIKRFIESIFGE